MPPAIKIENLSKQYRLGVVGTGTISHDLNRWWHRVRGKEDPYTKIGQVNDRTRKSSVVSNQSSATANSGGPANCQLTTDDSGEAGSANCQLTTDNSEHSSDYVWALKDINLEVEQGEVLGIIGRNGAGKSTLLKLLSRVTAPTTGTIKSRGRIASLLEVGTGFHPELTGRENIYLNGAILGMRHREVSKQLDAIVDFSGCAKYLDTPVKRYSSGMMVRLGFAVAAHLECEILIVDEVLAVGDAEFQKKCIGKIQEVSQKGHRTVLFVSHNMGSIASLCGSAVLLEQGRIETMGETVKVVGQYFRENVAIAKTEQQKSNGSNVSCRLLAAETKGETGESKSTFSINEPIIFEVRYSVSSPNLIVPYFHLHDDDGKYAFVVNPRNLDRSEIGSFIAQCRVPRDFLNSKTYILGVALVDHSQIPFEVCYFEKNLIRFSVMEELHNATGGRYTYMGDIPGTIRPDLDWSLTRLDDGSN